MYMEDSELSAFLIWKVQSSVPSLYGMFTVGYKNTPLLQQWNLESYMDRSVPSVSWKSTI